MVALPETVTVSMADLIALAARSKRVEEALTAADTQFAGAFAQLAEARRGLTAMRDTYKAWDVQVRVSEVPPAGSGAATNARAYLAAQPQGSGYAPTVPTTPPSGLHDARANGTASPAAAAMRDAAADGAYTPYADDAAVAALIGAGCTVAFVAAHHVERGGHGNRRPCPAVARGVSCNCVKQVGQKWAQAQKAQQAQARVDAAVNGTTAAPTVAPVTAAPDPMNPLANAEGRATWNGYVKAYMVRGMSHADAMLAADDAMSVTAAPVQDAPVAPVQTAPSTDATPATDATPSTDALPCPTEAKFLAMRSEFHAAAKLTYIDALYHARSQGAPDPDGAAFNVDAKAVIKIKRRFAGLVAS